METSIISFYLLLSVQQKLGGVNNWHISNKHLPQHKHIIQNVLFIFFTVVIVVVDVGGIYLGEFCTLTEVNQQRSSKFRFWPRGFSKKGFQAQEKSLRYNMYLDYKDKGPCQWNVDFLFVQQAMKTMCGITAHLYFNQPTYHLIWLSPAPSLLCLFKTHSVLQLWTKKGNGHVDTESFPGSMKQKQISV